MTKKTLSQIFYSANNSSIKHESYFAVYESLFNKFRGGEVTFLEVGVFNGGSLNMWKEYFGSKARIIGVDLNPVALKLIDQGFEIYIGDQESKSFWLDLKSRIGKVDIILDDGGHKNLQQAVTLYYGADLVSDGGLVVIEDVHTSYFRRFGNPGYFSFVNFSKRIIDIVNSRFAYLKKINSKLGSMVWSIQYFESIVAFNIDRSKCKISVPVANKGYSNNATDFRHESDKLIKASELIEQRVHETTGNKKIISKIIMKIFDQIYYLYEYLKSLSINKYLK
ncbi:hypothetical protein PHIN8_02950 [Polynucleobacter sp. HIN8]|uniref:hypothetical protein n=1 Tax=Polynucleobacter sp. HIN8 TaxID=3047867 RepID=UPI002573E017|nr:hypothetical protein [Polynucleobacter sp. HIN8]BEI38351.1 hypothetical protein PHIN8_02950 [Polynucleobacter sp. HIN8]